MKCPHCKNEISQIIVHERKPLCPYCRKEIPLDYIEKDLDNQEKQMGIVFVIVILIIIFIICL